MSKAWGPRQRLVSGLEPLQSSPTRAVPSRNVGLELLQRVPPGQYLVEPWKQDSHQDPRTAELLVCDFSLGGLGELSTAQPWLEIGGCQEAWEPQPPQQRVEDAWHGVRGESSGVVSPSVCSLRFWPIGLFVHFFLLDGNVCLIPIPPLYLRSR